MDRKEASADRILHPDVGYHRPSKRDEDPKEGFNRLPEKEEDLLRVRRWSSPKARTGTIVLAVTAIGIMIGFPALLATYAMISVTRLIVKYVMLVFELLRLCYTGCAPRCILAGIAPALRDVAEDPFHVAMFFTYILQKWTVCQRT